MGLTEVWGLRADMQLCEVVGLVLFKLGFWGWLGVVRRSCEVTLSLVV